MVIFPLEKNPMMVFRYNGTGLGDLELGAWSWHFPMIPWVLPDLAVVEIDKIDKCQGKMLQKLASFPVMLRHGAF